MIKFNRHIFDNGLRLVHSRMDDTEMVALNIIYDVGAKDESPEHTGFAHLFEHLMFGGSVNVPDFDTPLQKAGGADNAWTNNDFTNYYITVPACNVETAFRLESDRMLGLAFSPDSLDVQKHVVCEEFKQSNLNKPYGDVGHLMRDMCYKVHPYRWPTIGKCLAHIEQATLEQVKSFFYSHYAPDNAVLAVTGNISFEEAVRLTGKWFGDIERRNVPKRNLPVEPPQTEQRRLSVDRDVPLDALYMSFHMCGRMHPDYYAFDMLSDILSNGNSSRLIRRLVMERNVFSGIDAYITGSVEPGMFQIAGKPVGKNNLEKSEACIWEEIERLKSEPVGEYEIEKVKNKFESDYIFSNMNYLNVASNLAMFELVSEAEDINREVEKYRKVTAEDLMTVAGKYLKEDNSSVLYVNSK